MANSYETFEQKIQRLTTYSEEYDTVTLNEIIAILGHSSNYVIILFLVTPFLQPIPLFVLSTICGLLIALCSVFIVRKKSFFLPRFAKKYAMKGKTLHKICIHLKRLFDATKGWLHTRGRFMSRHILMRVINGSVICLLAFLLALPLPIPFTNTLPSISIVTLCFGALKEDGLVISLGLTFSLITVAYFWTAIAIPLHFVLE